MLEVNVNVTVKSCTIQSHTVCTVHLVWEGGGKVREKVEGQQYTSIVPSSMEATVHKVGQKYQPNHE